MNGQTSASKLRDEFAEFLNRVAYGGERIVLNRHGKPIAALVTLDDLNFLEELENQMDVEAARRALAESDELIPYLEVQRKLGLS